jgi:hypothetical protein
LCWWPTALCSAAQIKAECDPAVQILGHSGFEPSTMSHKAMIVTMICSTSSSLNVHNDCLHAVTASNHFIELRPNYLLEFLPGACVTHL